MKIDINQIFQEAIDAHQDGKLKEAEELYELILKDQPKHPEVNHNLGIIKISRNKVLEALPLFKIAIEINPKIDQFWLSYADALIRANKFEEAKDISQKIIKSNPELAKAHLNLGNALLKLEKLNDAELSFKKTINLDPKLKDAHYNLGVLLQKINKLNDAESSYKKALELNPDFAEAHNNLGIIAKDLGKLDEAVINYKKAIIFKPKIAETHNNLGNILKEMDKFDEAQICFNKAIELKPDFTEAHYNLANLLNDKGELLAAINCYKKVLNIQPDFVDAWYNVLFPLQVIKLQTSSLKNYLPLPCEQINNKYPEIAKSILDYRLNLGNKSTDSSIKKVLNILSTADNTYIKNPKIPSSRLITDTNTPNKITAMVHFGRSGTGLLHSLIDGHPEVSTLPSIYFSELFDHFTWKKITAGGWEEMADRFAAIYAVLFDASSSTRVPTKNNQFIDNIGQKEGMINLGINKDEVASVDKKVFIDELKRLMDCYNRLDAIIFFKLVHSAYEKTLQDYKKKKLIFYHIHNPDTYAQLNFLRLAPNANWLMMVREPLQSCESWIKKGFFDNDYKIIAARIFQMLFELDLAIFRNKNSIGVKLEDLKEHPKKTIHALCRWLGIDEKDSLYQMSVQGKKWWGDPTSQDYTKDGMNPFGKSSINRKLGSVFSKNDQFILRTLFYPFSVRFGYIEENLDQFKNDLITIRPMLDHMFDFEKKIAQNTKINTNKFMVSGSYLYLRSGMIERWNTLNKLNTYTNMLTPLKIN